MDPSKEKDPELVYKAWLRARFDEFVNSLIEIAVDSRSEEALKVRIFSLKTGFFGCDVGEFNGFALCHLF